MAAIHQPAAHHHTGPDTHAARDIRQRVTAAARAAASARRAVAQLNGDERDRLLRTMADALTAECAHICHENAKELDENPTLDPALRDRLRLDEPRLCAMADAVRSVAAQPAVLGEVVEGRVLGNGIRLEKRRVPLGTVLVIYESRPNVTSDAASLCIKAGNSVVLKGGREARRSNTAIADALRTAIRQTHRDLPELPDAVTLIDVTDRAAVTELVQLQGLIDLAIPRGGPGLIKAVTETATIPVVKHDAGVCHMYIDEHLDGMHDQAAQMVVNAKCQRPGVCNAIETLLVHAAQAEPLLQRIGPLLGDAGVEIRGCERTRAILPDVRPASAEDWPAEYLDLILAVRVVETLEDAIEHIETHGSQHTDAVVTASQPNAVRFAAAVTSANVMVNCSTRFADGGQYGLGAEIGISTDKLHARGPMGARDLTTYQWIAVGGGQIRS